MTRVMILINRYKSKIAVLQQKQKTYEARAQGGACISLQGKIQAYNAVIKDLNEIIQPDYKYKKDE